MTALAYKTKQQAVRGASVRLNTVTRSFGALSVLDGIDLDIEPGSFVAIVGQSGSGKSTLLNLIGLLEKPSGGSYLLNGTAIQEADDDTRTRARLETLGFVFQFHHLLPELTAFENVLMPALIARAPLAEAQAKVAAQGKSKR